MIKFLNIFIIVLILLNFVKAENKKIWVKSEDAVILSDETNFRITDKNEGEYTNKISILIKNDKAKKMCDFWFYENQFISIENIEAYITDTQGNIIKELDDDDIKETSFTFGTTLHGDATYKYFTFDHFQYPYIINLTLEMEFESLFYWADWYPQNDYPVIKSSYKLIMETPVKFNTYAKGIIHNPEKFIVDGDSVYFWQMDSIPAFPDEPLLDPEDKVQYKLLFSPQYFSLDGVEGTMQSWDAFAAWRRTLYKNQYALNKQMKNEIDELLKPVSSDLEKIRTLYKYLQEKTRYVAIELGIGGWQPYSAIEVYNNRYGDCKDLSTFMIGMLNYAGINAYPAIIRTRNRGVVYKNFPNNYFNHVIACVPLEKDTIWLECTSDYLLAGELPYNDEGCNVFVITDSTGKIVTTPKSKSSDNFWQSKISGEINQKGDFEFNGVIKFSGNLSNYFTWKHFDDKPDDFKEVLSNLIGYGIPGLKLDAYKFTPADYSPNSKAVLDFNASFSNFGNKIGKRLFIRPGVLSKDDHTALEEDEKRINPVYIEYAYFTSDTVSIKIPFGYYLEAAPPDTIIETELATYKSGCYVEKNIFIYTRYFKYKTNHIPAEKYDQLVEFTNAVISNDQKKFVFKKH